MRQVGYVVALAALASVSGLAQAAVVLDQSNLATVSEGGFAYQGSSLYYQPSTVAVSRLGQLQSVTAGRTGRLTRVDLQLFGNRRSVPFNVSIAAGEPGGTGPIITLGSLAFVTSDLPPAPGFGPVAPLFSVDLSSLNINVTAGQKFSLLVSLPASGIVPDGPSRTGPVWIYGTAPIEAEDVYPEGYLNYAGGFNTVLDSDGTRTVTAADRGFRTYVDVAGVPEPASWALMIAAFGLVGTAGRQRRTQVQFQR